ncbi:hypothetical protein CALVIDRAFT_87761 [Calocera viscosa TUFC12733]|uniref:Uncharacterized protein n=1 Tax=Calocera viscosa (strain TUFC12733) TaxID=1330018 RepID=A0A167N6X8_CALVF|nr:hypothetical protein CALVIDRAFT_87761 [Calocera viscosa TUFC12733]
MMQTELVQLLAQHVRRGRPPSRTSCLTLKQAPYHTERGWENYLRKHKAEVTKAMQEQSVKTREGIPSVAEPADSLMPRPLHDPPNGQEIDAFEDEDGASAQVTERTFDEILAHLETIADPWSSSEDAWEPFAESVRFTNGMLMTPMLMHDRSIRTTPRENGSTLSRSTGRSSSMPCWRKRV